MFTIIFMITFVMGFLTDKNAFFITSGLFAIAAAIESFTYKYFKNK